MYFTSRELLFLNMQFKPPATSHHKDQLVAYLPSITNILSQKIGNFGHYSNRELSFI